MDATDTRKNKKAVMEPAFLLGEISVRFAR